MPESSCAEVGTVERALAQVAGRAFRLGPARLIGAELEWLTEADGERVSAARLATALGRHAPRTIDADSPWLRLAGGAEVSVEPGGQVELASAPGPSARGVCDALTRDTAAVAGLLAARGITMRDGAVDTARQPGRILAHPRYAAMAARFERISPLGAVMMCNTAAVQVSVDCGTDSGYTDSGDTDSGDTDSGDTDSGDTGDAAARWALLQEAGPALAAAFADSPELPGHGGDWASQRLRTWLELDPERTGFGRNWSGDGDFAGDYARWALDVPLLCARRPGTDWTAPDATFADWLRGDAPGLDRPPTTDDLAYHLTTLFPPVRACGHLEVRYLDAQPGGLWRVPIAALDALLRSPAVIAEARAVAAPDVGRWRAAAERGLADASLRESAGLLLELAAEHAEDDGFAVDLAAAALRCKRGLRPSAEAS